jgi:hypothetical protein
VPLVDAAVVVRNLATGAVARGVTGKDGSYRFAGLGPGEYRLEADVPKLGRGAVEGILVSAGHATRVQAALVMELPTPSEEPLTARELPHELDPVAPAVTTVLSGEELRGLPANSRNWVEFEALTPVANPAGAGGPGAGRDGQLGDSSDGRDAVASPMAHEEADGAGIDGMESLPAFQAVAERREQRNGELGESAVGAMEARSGNPDVGSASDGVLRLFTDRGTNGLHGQAFYLNRQGFWAARNPFTQWVKEMAPAAGIEIAQFAEEPYTPEDLRQTFGFGVGRHLKRDKLYWFAAMDGLLRNDPGVAMVRHADSFFARPSDNELHVLATRLGMNGNDSLDQAVAAYSTVLEEMAGLLGPVPRRMAQWQGFGRVDWQMTDRQHLSVEGSFANLDAPGGGRARSTETYGSHSFGNVQGQETWGLAKLESFLTADLLNVAGAQFRGRVQSETAQIPSDFEKPLIANSFGAVPEIIADSKYGFVLGTPAGLGGRKFPEERVFQGQDTVSWVHGAHMIKAGGSFDHLQDTVGSLVNQTGTYSYADVLNFVSDLASFEAFGLGGVGNGSSGQHNCDQTGRVYVKGSGVESELGGVGSLPCYAWYSQRTGPANWHLSTNDLAGFATEQWQPFGGLTISAGVRVAAQQLPPRIGFVDNPALPQTERLPGTVMNWGPRVGVAWSPAKRTVLRAGAGLYFGRIGQAAIFAALTQTGSFNGDLDFFFKPTDVGAPPFPFVFGGAPQTVVTPGAVAFAKNFRAQEVAQGVFSVEQELPGRWVLEASGMASLGRRLPISVDTNLVRAVDGFGVPRTVTYDVVDGASSSGAMGPIKASTIEVPLYTERGNASYQQVVSIEDKANSTYEAGMLRLARYGGRGLNVHAHYVFAHAADWNPNESGQVAGNDVLDPADFRLEYGRSNLDIRQSAGATVMYSAPWKLQGWEGVAGNGWSLAAVGQFRSGLPYTMRTGGYIPGFFDSGGNLIEGLGTGMNGSAGDNRVYGLGGDGKSYNIGRNTYRYPATYTGNMRVAKRFDMARHRQLEFLAESFNLLNHQNVTLLETTGYTIYRGSTSGGRPTFNFLTGLTKAGLPSEVPEFGKALDVNATNFYRPREFQFGVRLRF